MKKQPKKKEISAVEKKQPQKKELAAVEKKQPKKKETPVVVKTQPKKEELSVVDLGTRYKCYKCGTKFYDLGRPQPLCPSCGEDQNNEEAKGLHKRKKRRRPFTMTKADPIITAPEERDDLIEVVNEVEAEYALDVDDIVLEESTDTDSSE
ncbi:MAG: FYDLN acid domain-containing protein [Desulfomonilia bacterium]